MTSGSRVANALEQESCVDNPVDLERGTGVEGARARVLLRVCILVHAH